MTADASADTRVVVVNGARQVGRSTLVQLAVERIRSAFSTMIENFVLGELARQFAWASGEIVGIEVKAAETVRAEGFRGLRRLAGPDQRPLPRRPDGTLGGMRLVAVKGLERELARCEGSDLTYPEHGATAGRLPAGYHHVRRRILLGHGPLVLDIAAAMVMSWGMHRRAGLRPVATAPAADVGATVVMCAGWGPVGVLAACKVVWTREETNRRGFAYGTLPDHPEIGEEAFVVERDAADAVWLDVTAFSRPNGFLTRLAGPAGRGVQSFLTTRYARAVSSAVS